MPLLASKTDHKIFFENQSIRGLFGFESSLQVFGIFLASLVRLKSVK
jgi:hypothetical protein